MSKTLLKLIDKALERGEAKQKDSKRGHTNEWKVSVDKSFNGVVQIVTVEHYDTEIARIQNAGNGWYLDNWDGYSASDRDALNVIAEKFGLVQRFNIKGGELKESISFY